MPAVVRATSDIETIPLGCIGEFVNEIPEGWIEVNRWHNIEDFQELYDYEKKINYPNLREEDGKFMIALNFGEEEPSGSDR
ncbi:MAG TPA: hypothetical protein VGE97_02035 [Nitrososphaera sp.]|jgi:hypothetical protein